MNVKKFARNTLTGMAIGAKSLVPGGDVVAQNENTYEGPITGEVHAPTVNFDVKGELKLTYLKLGKFGSMYSKASIIGTPLKSEFRDRDGNNHNIITPVSSLVLGNGFDINLGESTKLDFNVDVGIAPSQLGVELILKHNLKSIGIPNINAYAGVKHDGWRIKMPSGVKYTIDREGIYAGAEYEKQITENLKFNARAGFSHNYIGSDEGGSSPFMFHGTVGLHYKLPKLKMPEFDFDNEPTPKRQKMKQSKPQKRKVSNTVPCHAYPQQRGSESKIFNRPNEMR